jgi:hypothetical protein
MKSKQYVNEFLLEHIVVDAIHEGPLLARGRAHECIMGTFEADDVYTGCMAKQLATPYGFSILKQLLCNDVCAYVT